MGYGPADCYDFYGYGDFETCDTGDSAGVAEVPSKVDDFVNRR